MRFDQYVSLGCLVVGLGLLPLKPTIVVEVDDAQPVSINLDAAQIPVLKTEQPEELSAFVATLSAQAIYVMDVPSAAILLSKNTDVSLSPASTTKLMTALVAADAYTMDRVLAFTEASQTEGTVIGLEVGEELTVQDLLQGLLIQSGNDAAMVLANNYEDGYAGFVKAMNQKAQELHLDQTSFTNPSGLDDATHRSSARDLAILSLEVAKHPVLSQIVRTKASTVTDVSLSHSHPLVNTNELLIKIPEIVGMKTGTTPLAGEVLITRYKSLDRELIAVVMGSQDRYGDTQKLYNWIFSHYSWLEPESATLTLR